jgi:hypothetical protein
VVAKAMASSSLHGMIVFTESGSMIASSPRRMEFAQSFREFRE